MSRSTRLLALLQSLRARRGPATAAELAAEFGISERTVYRDVAALAHQGAPIECAPGVGYVLRRGFFLPPLMLEGDEADAIMLGLRFVMRRGDAALAAAANAAMAKVTAVLPNDLELSTRLNGLVVGPSSDRDDRTIALVRDALGSERKLRLDYRDGKGSLSERVVWPVALGFFDEAEVLAAWCELRADFRHFRLDRIQRAERLDARLPTPRRILLAEWRAIEGVVEV